MPRKNRRVFAFYFPLLCLCGIGFALAQGISPGGGSVTAGSVTTFTNKTLVDQIDQETHVGSFSVTANTTPASIAGLAQVLTASGSYSCRGYLHFTTAPTTSNGLKLQLATSDTLTVTTLNFTAVGLNGAAFATTGTGTATALASTAVSSLNAFSDVLLEGVVAVNAGGTLQVQIAENTSNVTIAGNAGWDCHRAS